MTRMVYNLDYYQSYEDGKCIRFYIVTRMSLGLSSVSYVQNRLCLLRSLIFSWMRDTLSPNERLLCLCSHWGAISGWRVRKHSVEGNS